MTASVGQSCSAWCCGAGFDMIERNVKAPNLLERVKEEIEAVMHREKKHHKETHGMSDDIDESTPIDKIKGPNIFERAKEELEAIEQSIQGRKELVRNRGDDGKDETGCLGSIGRGFKKFCSPSNGKRD